MRTLRRTWVPLTMSAAIAAVALLGALPPDREARAQEGGKGKPDFAPKFWDWLQQADYQNWAPPPGQGADFYEGESPHGAFIKTYFNRTAIAKPTDPPHGSIIVKENYGKDKKLMAVTLMYRIKGYDEANRDWFWAKYMADGKVAKKGTMPLAGKLKGCISCHKSAGGDDLIFLNDRD